MAAHTSAAGRGVPPWSGTEAPLAGRWFSCSVVCDFGARWTTARQAPPCFPGENTGVGCHSLLHAERYCQKSKQEFPQNNRKDTIVEKGAKD